MGAPGWGLPGGDSSPSNGMCAGRNCSLVISPQSGQAMTSGSGSADRFLQFPRSAVGSSASAYARAAAAASPSDADESSDPASAPEASLPAATAAAAAASAAAGVTAAATTPNIFLVYSKTPCTIVEHAFWVMGTCGSISDKAFAVSTLII